VTSGSPRNEAALQEGKTSIWNATERRCEEMRRKIAELDAINEQERRRLEEEQRQAEERQLAQEAFEREVQEQTERTLRELQECSAREAEARAERDDAAKKDLEDRTRRRQEQQHQEEQRSRQMEERRREGRSEKEQLRWQVFEEELEKQWAEQEQEEKRRLEAYARDRRRVYEEFDRRLTSERHRLASQAEFHAAARQQCVRNAAYADEAFYGAKRSTRPSAGSSNRAEAQPKVPPWPPNRPPQPGSTSAPGGAVTGGGVGAVLSPDESTILKELQSVRSASRDIQKMKVKDLLFRWHPDKNPTCAEKATRLFQFVQKQRELVLSL